jgi:hypothetical protein
MIPPFDIFRTEASGTHLWLESARNLEDAKARIRELGADSPGEYLILSQKTGNKLVIKIDGVNDAGLGRSRPVEEGDSA